MSWYEQKKNTQRLATEKQGMREQFPNSELKLERDHIVWYVTAEVIDHYGKSKGPHTIRIVYPHGYPASPPMAYPHKPDIRRSPHSYTGNEICLLPHGNIGGSAWDPAKSTAVTIAVWAFEWLEIHYYWKETGHWPSNSKQWAKEQERCRRQGFVDHPVGEYHRPWR